MADLDPRQTTGEDTVLTRREKATLGLFVTQGGCNEGMMADKLWPLIRNPRLVANSLCRKGLVRFGAWWDEDVGYELHLTDEGRAVVHKIRVHDDLAERLAPR